MQIVDDVLDLTGSASILGKPALNDLKSGVATAPVLFAAQQQPELSTLIRRKFKGSGDLDKVRDWRASSSCTSSIYSKPALAKFFICQRLKQISW